MATEPSRHRDPGEIVGSPSSEYVPVLVLLLVVACADVAIFYQILATAVLQALPNLLVWLAVAGFTTCSLLLAHFVGRLVKDRRVGHGPSELALIVGTTSVWLALGLAAFVVRVLTAEQGPGGTAATAVASGSQTWAGAALFLVLYIGSGTVSAVGAYLARNLLRDRFHKARRRHRRARKQLRSSQAPYERTISVLQMHVRNRQRELDNHTAAEALRVAYAREMRAHAELRIAAHLQDPSATTGLTTPRRARSAGATTT